MRPALYLPVRAVLNDVGVQALHVGRREDEVEEGVGLASFSTAVALPRDVP